MNLLFFISKRCSTGAAGIEYGSFNDDLNDMHDVEHYTSKSQIQTFFEPTGRSHCLAATSRALSEALIYDTSRASVDSAG
jgi:hypothetical protein